MAERAFRIFLFFILLFEIVSQTNLTGADNSEGFLDANHEVKYIVDGVAFSVHQDFTDPSSVGVGEGNDITFEFNEYLRFDPPFLDFNERHMGIPHHEKVTLFNINSNKTVHLSSISGETVHFHSSFFEAKMLLPSENTSFSVVFLGREEGTLESNLFIHTSEGVFKYKVKGISIDNPYRVRPLVGIELPINATFSPVLSIHNPFIQTLHIVEVYSSGGDFRLELPSGQRSGPKQLWDVPPFETRPIIKLIINSTKGEKNYTGYVRIKFDHTDEFLIVPIHIRVTATSGLYSPHSIMDFGVAGNHDSPKTMDLMLYNSAKKAVKIESITAYPFSNAVKIDYNPMKVPPDVHNPTKVATITFDFGAAFASKHWSGKILVKGKQNHVRFAMPYAVKVLEGRLEYDASVTLYSPEYQRNTTIRNFTATNHFDIPLAVLRMAMNSDIADYFETNSLLPLVLQPGETAVLFHLTTKSTLSSAKIQSDLSIYTNVSTVVVPVVCYNGFLKKRLSSGPGEEVVDFGLVAMETKKELYLSLGNSNPVSIELLSWSTTMPHTFIEFLGLRQGDGSAVFYQHDFSNLNSSTFIPPDHYALFHIRLVTPKEEGSHRGNFYIQTQYEKFNVTGLAQVTAGSFGIFKETLEFHNCHPAKICKHSIRVKSELDNYMKVTNLIKLPPDERLEIRLSKDPVIPPFSVIGIADIIFDARNLPPEQNYLGIPGDSTKFADWLQLLNLPDKTFTTDLMLRLEQQDLYNKVTKLEPNMTFKLDTTVVRSHVFCVKFHLAWATIVDGGNSDNITVLKFPHTQTGNTSYQELTLKNPSDSKPIIIHLIFNYDYPDIGTSLDISDRSNIDWKPSDVVPGTYHFEGLVNETERVEKMLQASIHKNTSAIILEPGESRVLKISFNPVKFGRNSAILFLRNNLTIVEEVLLDGISTRAYFKFGNRKPGAETPLLFELNDKLLRECQRDTQVGPYLSNLSVKRTFTARNTGDLPVYVWGFNIDGYPCEGYGYRVLDCEPFVLEANATRKIDIAFSPDFTLSRISRTLYINTSLGISVNYTLLATVPQHLLDMCYSILSRPPWELYMYYGSFALTTLAFFFVVVSAFLESKRLMEYVAVSFENDKPLQLLDLNRIANHHPKVDDTSPNATKQRSNSATNHASSRNHSQEKRCQNSVNPSCSKSNRNFVGQTSAAKYEDSENTFSRSESPISNLRNRKRNPKKNNFNIESTITSPRMSLLKKSWNSVFSVSKNSNSSRLAERAKSAEPDNKVSSQNQVTEASNKKVKENQGHKKSAHILKRLRPCAAERPTCSEEETSSTTTEGSTNDDVEKDRDNSRSNSTDHNIYRATPKKSKDKIIDYKDNYEGDCDEEECEPEISKRKDPRWKGNNKITTKPLKVSSSSSTNTNICKPNLELPYNLKPVKNTNRQHKETGVKRHSSESTDNVNDYENSNCNIKNSEVPHKPWAESKVSFSDVVARPDSAQPHQPAPKKRNNFTPSCSDTSTRKLSETSDSSSCSSSSSSSSVSERRNHNNPNTCKKENNCTVKNATFELGPIGSKKPNKPNSKILKNAPAASQNYSLFQSNPFCETPEDDTLYEDMDYTFTCSNRPSDSLWDDPTPLTNPTNTQNSHESNSLFNDPWAQSLWDPLYTPAVNSSTYSLSANTTGSSLFSYGMNDHSSSLFGTTPNSSSSAANCNPAPMLMSPTTTETSLFPSSVNRDSALYDRSSSDVRGGWGSLTSSVWAPPTWTTPTQQAALQTVGSTVSAEGNSNVLNTGLDFGPFNNVSNIWSPRPSSSDPWND